MPDNQNTSAQAADGSASGARGDIFTRRLFWLGVAVAAVIAFLALCFSYAPRYVVRYLIASELDALCIEHEGVETLDINPWTRELWLGPVRFGVRPSQRGRLGELGLILRVNPLFKSRVSVERLLLRGIDVVVTRSREKALLLNGIPLVRFVPPSGAAREREDEDDVWAAGADSFELRDSRLIFQEGDRGELEVEVERLALMDFRSWEPQRPGRFQLAARVNEIPLNWSGEVRPFADNVMLVIDSRTEQADVPKVVRFTGPWGLNRRDGTYDAQLRYTLTLSESGALEGRTAGTIDIEGADYERSGLFALTLERAQVQLDVRYSLSDSGDFALQGEVALEVGPTGATFVDATHLAVAAGRVSLRGLDAQYATDGRLKVAGSPEVDLESVVLSGPIEISVDKLLELMVLLQSLSPGQTVSLADTGLGNLAGRSLAVPSSDVKIGHLITKGETFRLQSVAGRAGLDLKAVTDPTHAEISVNQRRITIEHLESVLEPLSLASGQGRLALAADGVHVYLTRSLLLALLARGSAVAQHTVASADAAVEPAAAAASSASQTVAIEFVPGSAELSEAAKSYAAALAQLLAERPELSLTLCGRSTAQDMQAVKAAGRMQGVDLHPCLSNHHDAQPDIRSKIDHFKVAWRKMRTPTSRVSTAATGSMC